MSDCFHEFLELFDKGGIAAALCKILPKPDISYDSLVSNELLFPRLVNYVDATIFGIGQDIYIANRSLLDGMLQNKQLAEKYQGFIKHLKVERELLAAIIPNKILLAKTTVFNEYAIPHEKKAEMQNILNNLSSSAVNYLETKILLSAGWIDFQKTKPLFVNLCIKTHSQFTPLWFPFQYLSAPLPIAFDPPKIPLIFLEPINDDFTKILLPLKNKPAIFIFETRKSFLSMFQFPSVLEALKDPNHLIYILEIYPNDQLAIQNIASFQIKKDFQPAFFAPRKHIEAALPALMQALGACFDQTKEELKSDSEAGNWLYQIGKRLLYSIRETRLGLNRAPALMEFSTQHNWHDPHKGVPSKGKDFDQLPKDNMALKLSGLARNPRVPKSSKKIKLVHVVPQVIDGGHAPSLLLENLIGHHDPELFEIFLVSTERMEFHVDDYPYNFFVSPSSQKRAPKRLALFQSLGVSTQILNGSPSCEYTAQSLSTFLHQIEADIAVFHGPDAINYMAAGLTDTPIRVLFEHGTVPAYPGFDLAILSSHEAIDIYKSLYAQLNTDVRALPFQIDVKTKWQPEPYPKENWGLPGECRIMTTISNHLSNRLGSEMSLAIAEILQRVPDTYYVPLGPVSNQKKEQLNKIFHEYQVAHRVVYLGGVENPSQYARSMHLYLNEFPFGSGLGILDAMAAGCPIVSMYDENGPQQGRYGGHYFGIDRTITSKKRSDYVELACRLLNNPEMHKEWSRHSLQQYEKQTDVCAYVKKFEGILADYYHSKFIP